MSWAAHELESYFIQKHVKTQISYLGVLFGCLLPDLFTKLPVYGITVGSFTLKADTPWAYHRGWPGAGLTHSLMFGVVWALAVLAATRSRAWFLGILVGQFAHVLTDVFDSVGTMVFFPFTTQHFSTGMWAYAAQQGRYGDAAAYYSSFGGVWDVLWLVLAAAGFRAFSARYFFSVVEPNDGAWAWLQRRFRLSPTALLALYRAYFVYGASRIFAWFLWARVANPARGREALDWHWGGPFWVSKAVTHYGGVSTIVVQGVVGLAGFAAGCAALWWLVGRRMWRRGGVPSATLAAEELAEVPVEGRLDAAVYAAAAASFVALGVWLRTPVLNWLVGPAYIVAFVVTVTPRAHRLAARRQRWELRLPRDAATADIG